MKNEFLQDLLDLVISINKKIDKLDEKLERLTKIKDCLNGDQLLDNQDLCFMLKVTSRTLQKYRDLNLITYYLIEGKVYYKASEVNEFINSFEKGARKKKISGK